MNSLTVSKRRQLVLLCSVLLAGMLGISLASFLVSRSSMRAQLVEGTLPLVGDSIYSEIQHDLLRPVFVSSLMASNTFVHDWTANGETDISRMTNYLASIRDDFGAFTAFFVSDVTKNYYHAGGLLKTVDEDEPRDAWYFRVRDMNDPYEINTDIDMANSDELTVFVNYRVSNSEGRYLGAIGVGISSSKIKQLLNEYGQSFGRRIYFIDPNGDFQLGFSPHKDARGIHEVEGLADLTPQILANRDETGFEYRGNDGTVLLNSRWINELGWTLMVEQREHTILKPIFNSLLVNLAVSLSIAGLVLGIAARMLVSYQSELKRSATIDALTGAMNRQSFDAAVRQAFGNKRRRADRVSMIFVDIDHFKSINDRLGHSAGDEGIRHAVNIMQRSLRSTDVVCRWGGEEFCAMLCDSDIDDAYKAAENVRRAIAAEPFVHKNESVTMTVSIGVAERATDENENDFFIRLDAALYAAKRDGRNKVQLAHPPLRQAA